MLERFDTDNFYTICNLLGQRDADLQSIIHAYGYPPIWSREPGFTTLIHIILEQQVSLASASAAMNKLQERLEIVSPENLLSLSDEALKACYLSRQKIVYTRHLATSLLNGQLNLELLTVEPDEVVIQQLQTIKGIGHWTSDIYLMMALRRMNRFPLGDIALLNSIAAVKQLPKTTLRADAAVIATSWEPYRTMAAYLLWHAYLSKRAKKVNNAT